MSMDHARPLALKKPPQPSDAADIETRLTTNDFDGVACVSQFTTEISHFIEKCKYWSKFRLAFERKCLREHLASTNVQRMQNLADYRLFGAFPVLVTTRGPSPLRTCAHLNLRSDH